MVFFDAVRETAKVESFRKIPVATGFVARRTARVKFHGSSMAMGKAIAYPSRPEPANRGARNWTDLVAL